MLSYCHIQSVIQTLQILTPTNTLQQPTLTTCYVVISSSIGIRKDRQDKSLLQAFPSKVQASTTM
jgi:hypothetical protein